MKNLVTIFAVLFVAVLHSNFSLASTRSEMIKKQVEALAQAGYGFDTYKVGGATVEQIILNYEKQELSYEGEDLVVTPKEFDTIAWSDEAGVGTTSAKTASDLSSYMISDLNEYLQNVDDTDSEYKEKTAQIKEIKASWGKAINLLTIAGAKFGYTGNGPGYCGVSFVTLLVIDVETGTVYQIYMSASGVC